LLEVPLNAKAPPVMTVLFPLLKLAGRGQSGGKLS
jgi:hypothetical protein